MVKGIIPPLMRQGIQLGFQAKLVFSHCDTPMPLGTQSQLLGSTIQNNELEEQSAILMYEGRDAKSMHPLLKYIVFVVEVYKFMLSHWKVLAGEYDNVINNRICLPLAGSTTSYHP